MHTDLPFKDFVLIASLLLYGDLGCGWGGRDYVCEHLSCWLTRRVVIVGVCACVCLFVHPILGSLEALENGFTCNGWHTNDCFLNKAHFFQLLTDEKSVCGATGARCLDNLFCLPLPFSLSLSPLLSIKWSSRGHF